VQLPPRYALADIQAQMSCVADVLMTDPAFTDMLALNLDRRDVVRIVQALTPGHFYKSMQSSKYPHCFQDVYHTTYQHPGTGSKLELYVKVMQDPEVDIPTVGDYFLTSFKEK